MTYDNLNLIKVRDFFANDRYLVTTGIEILEVGDNSAVLSLDLAEMHYNAAGAVQGGAIYTLADSAFAVASNATFILAGEKKVAVNQSSSISYLKATKGKRLLAYAEIVSGGKRTCVYQMRVVDELGNKIAIMTGNACVIGLG